MSSLKILSYLVAKTLGGNDGDLIANALVGLEVESQLGVVALDDDLGGALDGLFKKDEYVNTCNFDVSLSFSSYLGADATHFGGLLAGWMFKRPEYPKAG